MAVPAIDQNAGQRCQEKRGDLAGKADDAEQSRLQFRRAQSKDKPARSGSRHPGADHGNELAGEEEAIIAMSQRPAQRTETAGTGRSAWRFIHDFMPGSRNSARAPVLPPSESFRDEIA